MHLGEANSNFKGIPAERAREFRGCRRRKTAAYSKFLRYVREYVASIFSNFAYNSFRDKSLLMW